MPDALYWQVIKDMDEALDSLTAESRHARDIFRGTNERIRNGDTARIIIEDMGARDRHRLEDAIHTAQARIRRARAHYMRVIVEEEGMTLTETAKLLGISRQAVSALYQEAINEKASTPLAEK